MTKNRIFREERPGEKKTIISLLLTGYIAVISILGYTAFFLNIQLGQVDRLLTNLNSQTLSVEQFEVLKSALSRSVRKLQNEIIWLAIMGSVFSIIGGAYTYNMVVRPLRKLVKYVEDGEDEPPQISSNNEIKQLVTAIEALPAWQASLSSSDKQSAGD